MDPNLDPELALALRVSMEEERARQEAAAKKAAEDSSKQEKGGEEQSSSQDATMTERAGAVTSEAENKSIDFMVGVISFLLGLFYFNIIFYFTFFILFLFCFYFVPVNELLSGGNEAGVALQMYCFILS